MQLKIEYVPIEDIKPYAGNAKTHPAEQIEQIKKSIEQFGFNDPIAIWHDEVVEGNGRLIAATELGIDTVPIIKLDQLTDTQRRAYALAHNKLTINSTFDEDLLAIELDAIQDINMQGFGFDPPTFEDLTEQPQEQQEQDITYTVKITVQEGDLQSLKDLLDQQGYKYTVK